MTADEALDRYSDYRQGEIDSAFIYQALAELEDNPPLADLYRRLAATESRHAEIWRARLRAAGRMPPEPKPSLRARILVWLARRLGPGFVLPSLTEQEALDSGRYGELTDDAPQAQMAGQERSHARLLRTLRAGISGGALAQLEGRHRAIGGNALRAAVLGANDGLLSNFSLIMGVAGASLSGKAILITGLAGLLAGAGSMALGEWISVQSSRELNARQVDIERAELEQTPEEEREELALIYQAKGLQPDSARQIADQLLGDRDQALATLAREELGIEPGELGGSPWTAAMTSFLLFAIGAVIPVLPYVFLAGYAAVALSVALSAGALFGLGAATTLMTGRGVLFSGARQLLIGVAAAVITFGVGSAIGRAMG